MQQITVKKLEEAGYKESLVGIALNKNKKPENMINVSAKLAFMDGGHNKFLEHIETWWLVTAPRWFWQQADTYRHASKSSQSTMHTIMKQDLSQDNFYVDIPNELLEKINQCIKDNDLDMVKNLLPESFMQTRMWHFSYKTLRNMIVQRKTHRMHEWQFILNEMLKQVEHPELLPTME